MDKTTGSFINISTKNNTNGSGKSIVSSDSKGDLESRAIDNSQVMLDLSRGTIFGIIADMREATSLRDNPGAEGYIGLPISTLKGHLSNHWAEICSAHPEITKVTEPGQTLQDFVLGCKNSAETVHLYMFHRGNIPELDSSNDSSQVSPTTSPSQKRRAHNSSPDCSHIGHPPNTPGRRQKPTASTPVKPDDNVRLAHVASGILEAGESMTSQAVDIQAVRRSVNQMNEVMDVIHLSADSSEEHLSQLVQSSKRSKRKITDVKFKDFGTKSVKTAIIEVINPLDQENLLAEDQDFSFYDYLDKAVPDDPYNQSQPSQATKKRAQFANPDAASEHMSKGYCPQTQTVASTFNPPQPAATPVEDMDFEVVRHKRKRSSNADSPPRTTKPKKLTTSTNDQPHKSDSQTAACGTIPKNHLPTNKKALPRQNTDMTTCPVPTNIPTPPAPKRKSTKTTPAPPPPTNNRPQETAPKPNTPFTNPIQRTHELPAYHLPPLNISPHNILDSIFYENPFFNSRDLAIKKTRKCGVILLAKNARVADVLKAPIKIQGRWTYLNRIGDQRHTRMTLTYKNVPAKDAFSQALVHHEHIVYIRPHRRTGPFNKRPVYDLHVTFTDKEHVLSSLNINGVIYSAATGGIRPTRCFKCQKIGHTRAVCKATQETCTFCAGNHASKVCWKKISSKQTVACHCVNCGQAKPSSHRDCPHLTKQKPASSVHIPSLMDLEVTRPMQPCPNTPPKNKLTNDPLKYSEVICMEHGSGNKWSGHTRCCMTNLQNMLVERPDAKEEIKALAIKLQGDAAWNYVSSVPTKVALLPIPRDMTRHLR